MSTQLCRACLNPALIQYGVSVFESAVKEAFLHLAGIIVTPQDNLPQIICNECFRLVTDYLDFREKILTNNKYLLEALVETKLHIDKVSLESDVKPDIKFEYVDTGNISDEELNLKQSKRLGIERQRKVANKSKKKVKLEKGAKRPRAFIELDPNKIRLIKLSKEEQIKIHKETAGKTDYLEMPFRCQKCYKGFNHEKKLITHTDKYHKPVSDHRCDICERTLSGPATLALHARRHQLLYECGSCKERFVEKQRALTHYAVVHEGGAVEIPCKMCDKVFRHRSTLNGHIRNHHPQTERPKCEICGKIFMNMDTLDDHKLIHSGERRHECSTCGARFRLRGSLQAHKRRHSASRPHYCAPCDAAFKSREALQHHARTTLAHLAPEEIGKYKCATCGRGFSSRRSASAHAATHAGKTRLGPAAAPRPRPQPPRRDHVCDKCAATFTKRRTLINHERVHTGERPHECGVCGARFAQDATLRTHRALLHEKRGRGRGAQGSQGDDGGASWGTPGLTSPTGIIIPEKQYINKNKNKWTPPIV